MTSASSANGPNASEAAYWVSRTGQKWLDYQQALDHLFSEVTQVLVREAAPQQGEDALDLGCGTGATSLAFSPYVAPGGKVVGVDISPLLLGAAKDRVRAAGLGNVHFIEADAQSHVFQPGSFDMLVSRYGSMFFNGPVAAFQNLRTALRPRGRIYLACWAPVSENPWFVMSSEAAVARLGGIPKPIPNSPGPFGFADRDYASSILQEAGFSDITAEAVSVTLLAPDVLPEAAALACNVGQAARIISAKNGTAEDATAIAEAVATELSVYQTADGIRVPATINIFTACCP